MKINTFTIGMSLLLALYILIPNFFISRNVPFRDSGVFLYMGSQILSHKLPYKDVWDHKPPLVFYLNACGLLVGRGTRLGVWIIEYLFLVLSISISFRLIRNLCNKKAAIIAVLSWVSTLVYLLEGGNVTQEYALIFQFSILYLYWLWKKKNETNSYILFLIGLCQGILLLLQPNFVGIVSSIILTEVCLKLQKKQYKLVIIECLLICCGALCILLLQLLFFLTTRSLPYAIDALKYNFVYIHDYSGNIQTALLSEIETILGIFLFSVFGWVLSLEYLGKRTGEYSTNALLLVGIIGFPIEFLAVNVSFRSYLHYYISFLPVMSVLIGFGVYASEKKLMQWKKNTRIACSGFLFAFFSCIIFPSVVVFCLDLYIGFAKSTESVEALTVSYIISHTKKNEPVLIWGSDAGINIASETKSPTRYIYQYPLVTKGYTNTQKIQSFLSDITSASPRYIVDTSPTDPSIPSLNKEKRLHWTSPGNFIVVPAGLHDYFDYIVLHYKQVKLIGKEQWIIYKRNI